MTRRNPRPWTKEDQAVAEVAAACGVTWRQIGEVLDRDGSVGRARVVLAAAQKRTKAIQSNRKANAKRDSEVAQAWKANNIEKFRKNTRRWAKANPSYIRERNRRRKYMRRAARRCSFSPATSLTIESRFGLWQHRCAFCGVNANNSRNAGQQRLTEDHVMALVNGGLDESSNIIPACFTCNSSKGARLVESWYRRQSFFTEARWSKIQRHCPTAVAGQLALAEMAA